MDVIDLRAEKIRNALEAQRHMADLHARRYTAMMVVALTVLATVGVAAAPWGWLIVFVLAGPPTALFGDQYRRYQRLGPTLDQATADANADVDRLINEVKEMYHDAPEDGS